MMESAKIAIDERLRSGNWSYHVWLVAMDQFCPVLPLTVSQLQSGPSLRDISPVCGPKRYDAS